MNSLIESVDARIMILKAAAAVSAWRAANSPADRDFKHALSLLMLLKGELRRES